MTWFYDSQTLCPSSFFLKNFNIITSLRERRAYLQRWCLGFTVMRSMRTLRQKRRSSTKLGSKNCVTIFGAEFGSAAAEYGPIRKKLWRQPSSFKQYFQTKLCSKKMWQNRLRFGRDVIYYLLEAHLQLQITKEQTYFKPIRRVGLTNQSYRNFSRS